MSSNARIQEADLLQLIRACHQIIEKFMNQMIKNFFPRHKQLLSKHGKKSRFGYWGKIQILYACETFDKTLYNDIMAFNSLRNVHFHSLIEDLFSSDLSKYWFWGDLYTNVNDSDDRLIINEQILPIILMGMMGRLILLHPTISKIVQSL